MRSKNITITKRTPVNILPAIQVVGNHSVCVCADYLSIPQLRVCTCYCMCVITESEMDVFCCGDRVVTVNELPDNQTALPPL